MDVVIYQMDVTYGKPDANLASVKKTIEKVEPKTKSLFVVPELFLTGYHPSSIDEVAEDLSSGYFSKEIQNIVHDHDILFYGSIPARFNNRIYNTGILVDKNGILANYKKSHLFGPMGEKKLFSAGREVSCPSIGSMKIGLSICYDLRFPGLYQKYAELGAELSLICAEWPITRIDHWRSLAKARAIEHQQFVIAANRVGSDPEYVYGGHSAIFSPTGKLVAGANHADEDIIQTKIDLTLVGEFRNLFDVREDRWI